MNLRWSQLRVSLATINNEEVSHITFSRLLVISHLALT